MPLTVAEFSAKIKSKYPQYASIDDEELAQKIVDKYPQYKSQVAFEAAAQNEKPGGLLSTIGSLPGKAWQGIKSHVGAATREPLSYAAGLGEGISRSIPGQSIPPGPSTVAPPGYSKEDLESLYAFRDAYFPESAQEKEKRQTDDKKLQAKLAIQEKAVPVGKFGGKMAAGLALSTLVPGGGIAATLGKGAVANVPFALGAVDDTAKTGDIGAAAKAGVVDMAINTALDALLLGGGRLIKAGWKQARPAIVESLRKSGIKEGIEEMAQSIWRKATKLSPDKITANEAAERAGIPLTRAQQASELGTNAPTGTLGMIERTAGVLPGGKQVMEKHKTKVAQAIKDEVTAIKGGDILTPVAVDPAEAVKQGLEKRLTKMETTFGKFYDLLKKQGELLRIDGKTAAPQLRQRINAEFPIFKNVKTGETINFKEIPVGLPDQAARDLVGYAKKIENLENVLTERNYQTFRNLKEEIGNKAFEYYAKMDNASAKRAEYALSILYRGMTELEEAHIYKIAGQSGLDSLKAINKYFADTKQVKDLTKKLIGFDKDAGEHGFKTAAAALDNLLKPKQLETLEKILPLMDQETRGHLRAGMLAKFFDDSVNHAKGELSLAKMAGKFDAFSRGNNRRVMEKVLGKQTVQRIDDLIGGMQRANTTTMQFADPANASGTAAAWIQNIMGVGAIASLIKPAVIVPIATSAYLSRIAAKVMTKQALPIAEKAVLGTIGGAGVGYAVAPKGKKKEGAALGALAGLGVGAGPQLRRAIGGKGQAGPALRAIAKGPKPGGGSADIVENIKRITKTATPKDFDELVRRVDAMYGGPEKLPDYINSKIDPETIINSPDLPETFKKAIKAKVGWTATQEAAVKGTGGALKIKDAIKMWEGAADAQKVNVSKYRLDQENMRRAIQGKQPLTLEEFMAEEKQLAAIQ